MENNSQHNLTVFGKQYLENHNYDLISDLFWKTLTVISLQSMEELHSDQLIRINISAITTYAYEISIRKKGSNVKGILIIILTK